MTATLGRQALQDLKVRGVSNPGEFASLDDAVIEEVVRGFDADHSANAGALVTRLRSAATRPPKVSMLDREAQYGRSIEAWLLENFPELCDPGPHSAAIVAVIRLHSLHGKKGLSKRAHGSFIREFVREWEKRNLDPADRTVR